MRVGRTILYRFPQRPHSGHVESLLQQPLRRPLAQEHHGQAARVPRRGRPGGDHGQRIGPDPAGPAGAQVSHFPNIVWFVSKVV